MGRNIRPLNYKQDKEDKRDYKFSATTNYDKLAAVRPGVVDWTDVMSPVKDQGQESSCVGFSMAAMKEWQEITERKLAQKEYGPTSTELQNLSESFIYWNAKVYDGDPSPGTSLRYGMQVLAKKGVPTESFWPYSDKFKGEPLPGADDAAQWAKIGSYWRITTLEEVLTALAKQPVPIGIQIYEEFGTVGSNGIVPNPIATSVYLGGHAICLVGYDDTKRLLKFKNSWSKEWGDNGYGYLSYDYFPHIIDAWTCLDLTIVDGITPIVPVTPTVVPQDEKKSSSSKLPFIIGGIAALVIILVVVFFIFR